VGATPRWVVIGFDATATVGAVVLGVLTTAGVGRDVEGVGLSDIPSVGTTLVAWLDLLGAAPARPPTVMATRPATSTALPAPRLPNRAQPTRPRAKAITPTTSAHSPNIIVAPRKPELSSPIRTTSARPPQPIESATPNLRPFDAATCSFINGRAIVESGTPGARCSVHNSLPTCLR
jgi:hypothetical protein